MSENSKEANLIKWKSRRKDRGMQYGEFVLQGFLLAGPTKLKELNLFGAQRSNYLMDEHFIPL